MRVGLLIFALLWSCLAFAQTDFPLDKGPLKPLFGYHWIDSAYKLPHGSEFELRIAAVSHLRASGQVMILARTNGVWSARMFQQDIRDSFYAFREVPVKEAAALLWKQLDSIGVRRLKGLERLEDEVRKDSLWGLLDGKSYTFQLIDRRGHRQFYYHSPGAYASHFTAIKDFAKAEAVRAAIYEFFNLRD